MDTNRISLHAKRACVTLMAMLFAWQPVGTNLAYAVELNAGETAPAAEQAANTQGAESSPTTTGSETTTSSNGSSPATSIQNDGEQESTGSTAETESSQQTSTTDNGSSESNTTETADGTGTGSKANAKSGSDQDPKNTDENGNGSNEAAPQSSEEGIALADSGTYNPNAAFVDISSHCTASSTLYKDEEHNTPLDSTAIAANETFYATMNVEFKEGYRPTLSSPNVSYTFPSNLKVADMQETNLQDGNTIAGTWYIKDNVAYLKYNESYLKDTVIHAYANISCSLGGVDKGDGNSETITFPGSSESITVNTKDGSVSGSKFGGDLTQQWNGPTYDQATNSYTWTVKVSPTAHATNVVLTDTIGSNLTFVEGSFVIVDSAGKQTGTASATVSGQTATINLGDLSARDYYVQYKTSVKSLPTTDNTEISNASNSVECHWGTTDRGHNSWKSSGSPQSTKYSMVTKTVDSGQSTPDRIKWVVTLNGGSIKADMGGYTFSDTVGNDQSFNTSAEVTVTDTDGKVVDVADKSFGTHKLSFKFPSDAGEKQYKVVYFTHISSTSSKDAVSNTAEVTPPDTSKLPSGKATAKYTPPDTGTYISKALARSVDSANYNGKASWKSEILFSDMSESTDPTSIVFKDVFSSLPNGVQVSLNGDVTLETGDGTTLAKDTDYTITKVENAQGTWGELFKITFKGSDTVKNLIGANDAKVVVKYSTQTTQVSGEYPGGTYKNKSSVTTDKKSEISAEADYTIEKEVEPPAVIKNGGSTSWNADYDWGDGTRGAWITDWTAYVNCPSNQDPNAVLDLSGKDVIVTDTLPANSEVVNGSASYVLRNGYYPYTGAIAVTPTVSEGVATFALATTGQKDSQGNDFNATKTSVKLTYQTATKGSLDSKDTITNTAQAKSGSYNFPSGEGTATLDNKALSKTGEAISGSSARKYTITVNENAYDLVAGSDTLTLVDDLDYRGELATSTISVKSGSGDDLLANKQASYSLSNVASDGKTHTCLTINLPDSAKAIVTYQVIPAGSTGEKLENFSNACKLSGVESSELNLMQTFVVAASSGGTSSENLGLSITKFDYNGKKTLEGAVFELHEVDLDKSSKGNIVENKIAEATSNAKGKVTFGTAANPLASNTLYYFVETKAPAGYEISYTGKTYVMLKSDATKTDYLAAFDKAVALGLTPSSSRTYSAFDELSKGSFELKIEKEVEGADAPAGAAFTFHAEATGSNAASAPKLSNVTVKSTAKGASTYTGYFTGTLSESMQGKTFTYDVSETGTAQSGWTYDSGTYTATVKVTEQDGKLVGNVSYAKDGAAADKMTFTNTYSAPATGSFALKVKKTVNGKKPESGKTFTFSATATGDNASDAPKLENVTTDEDGEASFATASVGESMLGKTFTYTIHEVSTPDEGWTNAGDMVAQVKVASEPSEGKIGVTVSYKKATDQAYTQTDAAAFDNTAPVKISVSKKVVGATGAAKDQTFSFSLYDQTGQTFSPTPIDTLTDVKAGETKQFSKGLTYSQPGTYKYVVHEVTDGLSPEWDCGADVVVTVDVTKDEDGTLHVKGVKYGDSATDAAAQFTNTYHAPATAQLKVHKVIEDATAAGKAKEFAFELKDKDGKVLGTATAKGGETAAFDALTYYEKDCGTHVYTITENPADGKGGGWIYQGPVTATVVVGMDDAGAKVEVKSIKYTMEYEFEGESEDWSYAESDGTKSAKFVNHYASSARADIKVHKTVNGSGTPAKDEAFTFELYRADINGQATGSVLDTLTVKAGETAAFGDDDLKLLYSQDDDGKTFNYVVHEVGHNGDGWTAAPDVLVSVKVTDDGHGNLSAETAYPNGTSAAEFNNLYSAKAAKSEVKVEKTVNGGPIQTGEKFTFTLLDGEGKQVTGTSEITATKEMPTVSFGELEFTEAGTYTYTVHETSELGNGWTNDDDFTVTFTVEVGDDRNLKITRVEYGERGYEKDGSVVAKFNNLYETPTQPEKPTEPEAPSKPEAPKSEKKPSTQTTTVKATTVTKATQLPKTGDTLSATAPLAAVIATAGIALIGMAALDLWRRNKRNEG